MLLLIMRVDLNLDNTALSISPTLLYGLDLLHFFSTFYYFVTLIKSPANMPLYLSFKAFKEFTIGTDYVGDLPSTVMKDFYTQYKDSQESGNMLHDTLTQNKWHVKVQRNLFVQRLDQMKRYAGCFGHRRTKLYWEEFEEYVNANFFVNDVIIPGIIYDIDYTEFPPPPSPEVSAHIIGLLNKAIFFTHSDVKGGDRWAKKVTKHIPHFIRGIRASVSAFNNFE